MRSFTRRDTLKTGAAVVGTLALSSLGSLAARAQEEGGVMIGNMPYPMKFADVHGARMAYAEHGEGDPIVFLHGNPTSSYLWRNIMPAVEDFGRLIAPDLIGMGMSDKLTPAGPDRYSFVEHRTYLDNLLEQLDVTENVTLVIHDWGSGLGFDWAYRHAEAIKGIAYMEAFLKPWNSAEMSEGALQFFNGMRGPGGEEAILENNMFVEQVLIGGLGDRLDDADRAAYRAPYLEAGDSRLATLKWPREVPIDGMPAETAEILSAYSQWLPTTQFPKLLISATPGAILIDERLEFARTFQNQVEVGVEGNHYIQEQAPEAVAKALRGWLISIS